MTIPMDTLGFNLIVKNEENCLAQTLENIRPLADEIVVTDTGSTDNTVSIAESLADKVLFHEWQDSFSEARNWSLQHSTTNWICSIDADEWIENPETIDVTQWNGAQTLLCPIHSDMPNGQIAGISSPRYSETTPPTLKALSITNSFIANPRWQPTSLSVIPAITNRLRL